MNDPFIFPRNLDPESLHNFRKLLEKYAPASGSSATGRSSSPTTLTIPINKAGTPQLLDFSVNDYANGVTWNAGASKFVVVTAGVYTLKCNVSYLALHMQDGVAYSAIVKLNGTVVLESDVSAGGTSNPLTASASDDFHLAVGDEITFFCQTQSNSTMTISGASGVISKQ